MQKVAMSVFENISTPNNILVVDQTGNPFTNKRTGERRATD